MSIDDEIRAGLALESKREAKGVSWNRYQAVCDKLEGVQYELEVAQDSVKILKGIVDRYEAIAEKRYQERKNGN